jgi:hypothetical protein
MNRGKLLASVWVLSLLLQACLPGTGTVPTSTPVGQATTVPLPTSTSPDLPTATLPPTAAPQPTALPLPTNTQPPAATLPPVATATQPGLDRPEAIAILQPGPGSRVTGPVQVNGVADPTFEQSLAVSILLADGTSIATTSTQIAADVGQRGSFSVAVPFSVAAEQQGFIQVYAISAKDGGVTHLSSVGVTLLPGGTASIIQVPEKPEQILLLAPQNGAAISGGTVHVEGFGLASFEQTLVIDVLDETGSAIATTPVTVAAPDLGQPGPFSADIPYSLSAPTAGRIQVRDISPAFGGNTHLTSVEVNLQP